MIDEKDTETLDLLEQPPYLVISTKKKGFREFKGRWDMRYLGTSNWSWTRHIESAAQYGIDKLPELIAAVEERRAVTVGLVSNGTLITLSATRYSLEFLKGNNNSP